MPSRHISPKEMNSLKFMLLDVKNLVAGDMPNVDLLPHRPMMSDPNALFTLIDSIPALVAYIDCNMVLQYCNQPFRSWFAQEQDLTGRSFPSITSGEIFLQMQKQTDRALAGERAFCQISISTGKGIQYLDASLSPDFDDQNKVKGFVFHGVDVTEQSRTERDLKDYFENASIGLHWVDADGIIVWANPAELRMLGYSENEYIGHHISEFHADKDVIGEILNRLSNKKAITNYDAHLLCKDGSIRHVTINSSVLWEGNRFVHTRCFTVDVTEKKLAAEAVKESEERFRMMANLVPLTIWTTDTGGYCNFLSVRWKEATGQPVEQGLGEGWIGFIHPEDRENIRNSWTRSLSAKRPFEARFRLLNAEGGYSVNYANSALRYDASGEFAGYIAIFQDVSSDELIKSSLEKIVLDRTEDLRKRNADLKTAEKALQEKNKELEEINNQLSSFAHIASHDLQEPLRKIQAFSNRLFEMEGDKISEKGKELYRRIQHSSGQMKNLIQDLLTYSQSSGNEEKLERVDLDALFAEVVSELEIKIGERKAVIKNLGLPSLNIVRFQFHQLFLNLLTNAIKFTVEGIVPEVIVSSDLVSGVQGSSDARKMYHHITVKDNGIGFEPGQAEKIFEMFYRLHGRSEYEGTGLGLAICKKIVENHKGIIRAESRVNEGATFHIYLPA
jgi:PAS domain S-box-containing protein